MQVNRLTIAALLGLASFAPTARLTSQARVCAGADPHMAGLLQLIRRIGSGVDLEVNRDSLRIPRVDSASVRRVSDESLCRRALALMNTEQRFPDSTVRTVYLVRVGNRYWAEDPNFKAGEWIQGLVMDSTFRRILSRPGH